MIQIENVNTAIMSHELETEDWDYNNLAQQFYFWFDKFNEKFFEQQLGTPVISFESTDCRVLGHFVIGRNAIGAKWNININERYLNQSFGKLLVTLLHEMGHEWQQEFSKPGKSDKYNYHNKEFQNKMESFGIPCNSHGKTTGIKDPFVSFLNENGVEVEEIEHQEEEEEDIEFDDNNKIVIGPGSKLKKWTCGCTNVRVAIRDFQAQCLKCGNKFILV